MKQFYIIIFALLLTFAGRLSANTKQTISLNGTWTLSFWQQPEVPVRTPDKLRALQPKQIEAQVPGNVELDLMKAKLIDDPMVGSQVNNLRKWEGYQWCYSRKFSTPKLNPGERLRLYFGGIDCLADIWLNGKHIGNAENMMIEHTFDITHVVRSDAENELEVILRSSVIEGQKYLLGSFSIGNFPSEESVFIRKAPHTYGWDILPRLVSAGLWRDVTLQIIRPTHLRDVHYLVANIDTTTNHVRLFTDVQLTMPFEKFDKVTAIFTLSRKGKVVYTGQTPVVSPAFRYIMELEHADLWWPKGYGEAALYEARVELKDTDGTILASENKRIGLRTIQLDRTDINLRDKQPGRFRFIINGVPIFIRGTNWVPLDALHSRDKLFVDEAIRMTTGLNCNMIRCWGGNVYEDHRFFDLCDENGIMVWQDFTMGCTFYPQRSSFAEAIEKEVQSVVCKLRNHASLVLWSGNNEDDSALRWTLLPFNINPNKDKISREVIPSVLYEFDPTRPYLPSSPYYSEEVYEKGSGDEYLPENHLWGPRGYYKDGYYSNASCCFVSEIGYHGCPNAESLRKMMTKNAIYPWTKPYEWNDEWVTKSVRRFPEWGKTFERNNLMLNQIKLLFGEVPTQLDDFIFASQSVQAEAMKYFIEMWRGKKFNDKTGIIWWNIRDGWPVISDAIVDYYNSKKMAYYFIKNVQQDACVLINDAQNGYYPLIGTNDTRLIQKGHVTVTDIVSGKKIYTGTFTIPANAQIRIADLPEEKGRGMYLIDYEIGKRALRNHYLYGTPPFDLKTYKQWLRKAKISIDSLNK